MSLTKKVSGLVVAIGLLGVGAIVAVKTVNVLVPKTIEQTQEEIRGNWQKMTQGQKAGSLLCEVANNKEGIARSLDSLVACSREPDPAKHMQRIRAFSGDFVAAMILTHLESRVKEIDQTYINQPVN